MGEIITKSASVEDILRDLRLTLVNAATRGGDWKADAEKFFAALVAIADEVGRELAETDARLQPLRAAVDAVDGRADDLLAALYDELFNLLGRPGYDPLLAVAFPGGSSAYTEGPDDEQPERMELLVEILRRRIDHRIPEERALAAATAVERSAAEYRTALAAVRGPRVRSRHLTRMRRVLADAGQIQLARLKRRWKSEGKSEADIHEVIPDRPKKRGAETAGPTETAG